jgi:hypothetical protein
MAAKYEDQIKKMFIDVFKEDNVLYDCDPEKVIKMHFDLIEETYETLSDKIDIGVKNGYSVEWQLDLLKVALIEYNKL